MKSYALFRFALVDLSANTDPQQQEAASPQMLRIGCLRRCPFISRFIPSFIPS